MTSSFCQGQGGNGIFKYEKYANLTTGFEQFFTILYCPVSSDAWLRRKFQQVQKEHPSKRAIVAKVDFLGVEEIDGTSFLLHRRKATACDVRLAFAVVD